MKLLNRWFTLAELLISVVIGSTVLVFVFSFVTDAISWLAETNEQTKVINEFYEFLTKMDNYKNTYTTGSLVYDFPWNAGFDILMLKNPDDSAWVLIWVVDSQNLKLTPTGEYGNYTNRIVWFRDLTATNISDITATPSTVYDLTFFEDKVYRKLVLKDFQSDYYNTGSILDIELSAVLRYKSGLEWTPWNKIPYEENVDLFSVDLNF